MLAPNLGSFDRDINKLIIMLKVDIAYHTKCSINAIRNGIRALVSCQFASSFRFTTRSP